MKKILAVALLFVVFACNHTVDQSPREINWDRDICVNCLMGLADQKYCLEPFSERQLRTVENGASSHACLMATGATLPVYSRLRPEMAISGVTTTITFISIWPTGFFQCLFTLFLTAILLKKFRHTQTRLKLNSIYCQHQRFIV